MATIINQGGVYQVQPTDLNIYVKTGQPVTILAPISPTVDQTFRVFASVTNAAVMMNFTPNTLNKFGSIYTFGSGLDALSFVWDGVLWNAF